MDNFLRKPVGVADLTEAVNRSLERSRNQPHFEERKGVMSFAPQQCRVALNGEPVPLLSAREVRAFSVLWDRAGEVVPQEAIERAASGTEIRLGPCRKIVGDLRRKIEPNPGYPRFIITVRGEGVKLVVNPDDQGVSTRPL